MARSFSRWSRLVAAASIAVASLVGCASTRAPSSTTRVEVLATGFLVDNTILATMDELRAFLADSNARDVTLYATKDISTDRIDRAATAIRNGGANVEIVLVPASQSPPAAK